MQCLCELPPSGNRVPGHDEHRPGAGIHQQHGELQRRRSGVPVLRIPFLSAGVAAFTLGVWMLPGAGEVLQYERDAIISGEVWRPISGHFTHWTASHVFWDLVAFAVLGPLVECRSRALFARTVLASAAAISTGVWFLAPTFEAYRGLSGVDSALFGAVVAWIAGDGIARRTWRGAMPALAAGVVFAVRTVCEVASGVPVFVGVDAAFTSLPIAHLLGALTGAALGVAGRMRMRLAAFCHPAK